MKKVYVRAVERYTVWEATQPIEVNVEKLRQCEPPYEGETEADELTMECLDMEVYSDSREKYAQEWLDVGVPNDEYRKMGGFEVKATNVDDV